jgi:phosphotriesterase-related protein
LQISTVTGPISPSDLGFTLMHEHVIVAWDGTLLDSTLSFDRPAIEKQAVQKLRAVRAQGVKTIVDLTTIEMLRDVDLIRRVAEASEMQIICTTGLFADAYGIPHYFRELSFNDLTDLYVTEITEGIGHTGVKAGVIKVATGAPQLTEYEENVVRAAARAQRATGVPILTHTGRGGGGLRQIELLTEEGVPPDKIVIGHSDVSSDMKYHLRMLSKGVFVGFDRIGLLAFMPDEVRAHCIAALVQMGYAGQLTMSMDCLVRWIGRAGAISTEEREFTHLVDNFFPLLRKAGVDDATITQIMVENPKRIFP